MSPLFGYLVIYPTAEPPFAKALMQVQYRFCLHMRFRLSNRLSPDPNSMNLLNCLPDDLCLRIFDLLPVQERAKLALLSKACRLLSLDGWSVFSMSWDEDLVTFDEHVCTRDEGKQPKLSNLLVWLARLAQHSQHTLHTLEIHCSDDREPRLTLPRKLPYPGMGLIT